MHFLRWFSRHRFANLVGQTIVMLSHYNVSGFPLFGKFGDVAWLGNGTVSIYSVTHLKGPLLGFSVEVTPVVRPSGLLIVDYLRNRIKLPLLSCVTKSPSSEE